VCRSGLPGAQTPHRSDELFGSVYPHAPPAMGSRLSPCDPSVAHTAGAGLPGLLRCGVPVRDDLTRRTARTVLGPDAPSRCAAGDTPTVPNRPAALVSLRASSRQAHPSRAGARGAAPAARSDDSPDCRGPWLVFTSYKDIYCGKNPLEDAAKLWVEDVRLWN
jgi:hypothetical protein